MPQNTLAAPFWAHVLFLPANLRKLVVKHKALKGNSVATSNLPSLALGKTSCIPGGRGICPVAKCLHSPQGALLGRDHRSTPPTQCLNPHQEKENALPPPCRSGVGFSSRAHAQLLQHRAYSAPASTDCNFCTAHGLQPGRKWRARLTVEGLFSFQLDTPQSPTTLWPFRGRKTPLFCNSAM